MTSFAGSEPPNFAVQAFRLVRDDCSPTPPFERHLAEHPRKHLMRHLLPALLATVAALSAAAAAAETEPTRLLDAARLAGTDASALVFEGDAGGHPDDSEGTRISGKSLVLATAIASAAAITVAWLLRPRSECVAARGPSYYFARAWSRAGRYRPWTPPPAPAPALTPPPPPEPGTVPPPLPPVPPVPLPALPDLCVPRGSYR